MKTPPQILQHIASHIKLARKLRKLSTKNLAEQLHITRRQVLNYENSKSNISIVQLYNIARVLDVDIGFFLDDLNNGSKFLTKEQLELVSRYEQINDPQLKELILGLLKSI